MINSAINTAKQAAARRAIQLFEPKGIIGLGSGSTALMFIEELAKTISAKDSFQCVCTSSETEALAKRLGFSIMKQIPAEVDLTIDGADEVDFQKRMIKGGGGALLRERIIASISKKHITIIHREKLHRLLGQFPLPIEIAPITKEFNATQLIQRWILEAMKKTGYSADWSRLRKTTYGKVYVTDNNNPILDVKIREPIDRPQELSEVLIKIFGVMEHGSLCRSH